MSYYCVVELRNVENLEDWGSTIYIINDTYN